MYSFVHQKYKINKLEINEIGCLQDVIMGWRERETETDWKGQREGHFSKYTFLQSSDFQNYVSGSNTKKGISIG